jgi:hypothetical protein
MSVATHLGIDLADYDARIRTFIPDYETMLAAAAAIMPPEARPSSIWAPAPAPSRRSVSPARRARIVGIDEDGEILQAATARLGSRATFVNQSFLRAPLPACDAVVASFALHHVRTRSAKAGLYRRVRRRSAAAGFSSSSTAIPRPRTLARQQRDAWRAHLRDTYAPPEADALLEAWKKEDVYVPLDAETALPGGAGFAVEIVWRNGSFAVISGSGRR